VALGIHGDRKALEMLYRRHAAYAIRLASRIEGTARDADDVVHESFIKAFQRLKDLNDRSAFRGWLGAIVVGEVRSLMRHAKFMKTIGLGREDDPIDLSEIVSPAASPHVRAQLAQIFALLQTQPVDNRIAWVLREVEDHDLEHIAQLTGCSLATVKRRVDRVQRFLDDHFLSSGEDEFSSDDSSVRDARGGGVAREPRVSTVREVAR